MDDYRRTIYCKKCGSEFKEGDGGHEVKLGNGRWNFHADMCSDCAKEKHYENKPHCKSCGYYCYKTNECPVCKKPCCNLCGKMWPYYGFEVYVCSEACYQKQTKFHFEGLYPDKEF